MKAGLNWDWRTPKVHLNLSKSNNVVFVEGWTENTIGKSTQRSYGLELTDTERIDLCYWRLLYAVSPTDRVSEEILMREAAIVNRLSDSQISRLLYPYFEKHKPGMYFAHLNGSDLQVFRITTTRWDWKVEGRTFQQGSSPSYAQARVDAWRAGLNTVEKAAESRGELPIP